MNVFNAELEETLKEHPTINHFFEQAVEEVPNAIAIETDTQSITYAELNNKANCLARALLKLGVKPEQVVALQMERSIEMVTAILAILKAGGAYLPIDVAAPRERVLYMLSNSGAGLLLHQRGILGEYPHVASLDTRIVPTDSEVTNLQIPMNHTQLAYVIYTSGSTGTPKGVMIEHGSIINRLVWMKQAYQISDSNRILHKTPYTFDVSVWEMFLWFFARARLVLLPHGEEYNIQLIQAYIRRFKVTDCHFIPSLLSALLKQIDSQKQDITNLKSLNNVYCSGEVLNCETVMSFRSSLYARYGTRLHNLYGPTETAVDVTSFDCTAHDHVQEIVPIGTAIANTEIYILTPDGRMCADNMPGELCIAGANVGRGYIHQPELTQKHFVEDIKRPNKRMFKTGDLAKWQGDLVVYLGRMDNQVKIRGMRVEPEEIENAILQFSNICKVVVCGIRNKADTSDSLLAAMYESPVPVDISRLTENLCQRLPDYMIPGIFMHAEKLPLLSNGKLNRRAVKAEIEAIQQAETIKSSYLLDDMEEQVLSVIRGAIHPLVAQNVSFNKGLNEVGIDSMTYLSVVVALEEFFGIYFDATMLAYGTQTDVKSLIDYVIKKVDRNNSTTRVTNGAQT